MKVAIYCRLSEEDRNKVNKDDDSNSIKNQKAMLIQYAVSQELLNPPTMMPMPVRRTKKSSA